MGNKKVVKKTNISNTHVPDKVYAYMIQSHHMLYELLNCEKGDSVRKIRHIIRNIHWKVCLGF